MKIKNHSRLRLWFLLIFNIFQLLAIDFYGLLLMLLIIDFDWMLSSGSIMYKHLRYLQSRTMCVLSWLTVPRDQQWRDHFRYSPLYLTRYPILDSPLQCPTTHFRCLDFDDDDDDGNIIMIVIMGNFIAIGQGKKHSKGDCKISIWPLKNCIESP